MKIHPLAGEVAPKSLLANIPRLVSAYYTHQPDVSEPTQQVAFGTSGHRGSSLKNSFNQDHILAISQALCEYRTSQHIDGPLFMGMDTHALSEPALERDVLRTSVSDPLKPAILSLTVAYGLCFTEGWGWG